MWSAVASALALLAGVFAYVFVGTRILALPPAWVAASVPLAYAVIVALFVASYFALAWMWRAPRPPQARIGPAATLQLVWHEYLAILASPLRMILFRVLVPAPAPAPAALPVLLLHGVLCNAGVWANLLRLLRRRGIGPVYALSYGPPLASIEVFVRQVESFIARIRAETGAAQVMIVTHSMGGLVALAYLRRCGSAAVRRLVTIGAPYQGSSHARLFAGTSLTQLRPQSEWLTELDAHAPAGGPPVVSIWSWHDSMVTPQTSSILPGATNVALTGVGHNALLGDPGVLARVVEEYRRATSESPASAAQTRAAPA